MGKLQELKAQRDNALKIGDMQQLSEINKQISQLENKQGKQKRKQDNKRKNRKYFK